MGETGVGKTSILNAYSRNIFSDKISPTISVEFSCKKIILSDGSKMKVQIFDTAGQERYRSIVPTYCRRAYACLFVYDITNMESFNKCKIYKEEVKQLAEPNCVFVLIGNKIDLESKREVRKEEGMQYASNNGMIFYETTAKNINMIQDIFKNILESKIKIYNKNI